MPSDLEIAEHAINQVIFAFLDKHFKKYKDKGSLQGAVSSIQFLLQLNIIIAPQRACTLQSVEAV